jgi:hypothetical protein
MPEFKGSQMSLNLFPAGRAAKVVGTGLTKGGKKIYEVIKRKPVSTKREVNVEKLLKEALTGPDKRTAAQKRAANEYFRKTFKP